MIPQHRTFDIHATKGAKRMPRYRLTSTPQEAQRRAHEVLAALGPGWTVNIEEHGKVVYSKQS